MKKILIFSTAYYPFVGGAEVAVKEITDRLSDHFEFDLITARLSRKSLREERIGNVCVFRVGIGWPIFDKYLLAFCGHKLANKLHKKNNYNCVWSIMASYGGFAGMFFKKENINIPFLLTLQEGDDLKYIRKRVGLFYRLFLKVFRSADYIQTISKFLANWARDNGAKCLIEVVPNGVDLARFSRPENFDKAEFRKKLKINMVEKIIVTTSRLTKKNGLEYLVKAIPELKTRANLFILGQGEEENSLRGLVRQLKIESHVHFLGFQKHEEMVKYLWVSDLFVRPSLSEGLGNSFLEAMASGLPVIGTSVGGIPDFLADGETGLFCDLNVSGDLSKKIDKVFSDDELRERIINKGKKLVFDSYGWDKVADGLATIFNKLIR